MLRAVLDSIFGRGTRKGAVRRATPKAVASPSVQVRPRLAPDRPAEVSRTVSSHVLDKQLWKQVGVEVDALRKFWGTDESFEDAEELLHLLVQSHRTIIQQPPAAAQAVLHLLGKRSYGQAELTRQIERDPVLSQALLKHANSVFYASKHGDPVISIKGAVQRIGSTGVHATVMSQVVRGQLSRPGAVFDRMVTMAWDHMVAVAPIARSLARVFGADVESAYTMGLLHDIGKLVFFSEVAALRKRKRREVHLSPRFVGDALKRLHEPLGGIAALQWGLDPASAWVIAHHHRGEIPEAPDRLTELVYVAERAELASRTGHPLDLEAVWESGKITVPVDKVRPFLDLCGALDEAPEELPAAV